MHATKSHWNDAGSAFIIHYKEHFMSKMIKTLLLLVAFSFPPFVLAVGES